MLTPNVPTKSSHSGPAGNCVVTTLLDDGSVEVRDDKLGDESPVLTFTPAEWDAFLLGTKAGEFDPR